MALCQTYGTVREDGTHFARDFAPSCDARRYRFALQGPADSPSGPRAASFASKLSTKDQSGAITVRTSDGKIVKGKDFDIVVGEDKKTKSILKNAPFDPACYRAVSAHPSNFDGHAAEAIALTHVCGHHDSSGDGDFNTLYVDASSHAPLAATGGKSESPVDLRITQRFVSTGGYVLPASIAVRVKGSGLMFWLDVDAHADFTNYTFSDTSP